MINGSQILLVTVGHQVTATYTTTNADNSDVTLSMSGLPNGATFDPAIGLFSWLPLNVEPVGNITYGFRCSKYNINDEIYASCLYNRLQVHLVITIKS